MLLETIRDGRQRFEELVKLAMQLQVTQPADLTRLKTTQAALEIAVKIETLKQSLAKELGQD